MQDQCFFNRYQRLLVIFRKMKILLASTAVSVLFSTLAGAAPITQTFEGVTVANPSQPAALNSEFPAGTRWILDVAWDDASPTLDASPTQAGYRLTTLTLTLEGTSGDWSSSSVMDKAAFGLLRTDGYHEVQFTSGWGPADHTEQTIGAFSVISINLTLGDPTGTAIDALTPAPGQFDTADFNLSLSQSYLKFYLNNEGTQFIFGGLGDNPVGDPDLSVSEKGGDTLRSGVSTLRFKPVKIGKRGRKTILTVGNSGFGNLSGLDVKLSGPGRRDFLVSSKGSGIVAPGGTRSIEVVFSPKRSGNRLATLDILSNDPDTPVFSVSLKGKAKAKR